MTPFFKQSLTRALCAAAWGLPGALLWAAPLLASVVPVRPDPEMLIGTESICPPRPTVAGTVRSHMWLSTPAGTDSLITLADRSGSPDVRAVARRLLSYTRGERGRRWLAENPPIIELPPLVISP